jgi:uncharacterized protein (DUF433 family)
MEMRRQKRTPYRKAWADCLEDRRPRARSRGGIDKAISDRFFFKIAFSKAICPIDLAPVDKRTMGRMGRLAAARNLTTSDPEIFRGAPIIRGTRIPIYDVTASVAPGPPTERILTAHPTLDADNINLAAIYAESNPARGRLRSSDELSKEAKVVVDRRVPRRRKRR